MIYYGAAWKVLKCHANFMSSLPSSDTASDPSPKPCHVFIILPSQPPLLQCWMICPQQRPSPCTPVPTLHVFWSSQDVELFSHHLPTFQARNPHLPMTTSSPISNIPPPPGLPLLAFYSLLTLSSPIGAMTSTISNFPLPSHTTISPPPNVQPSAHSTPILSSNPLTREVPL